MAKEQTMIEPQIDAFVLLVTLTGALLLLASLFGSTLAKLPVSTAMIYLAAGIAAGPIFLHRFDWSIPSVCPVLMHVAEFSLLISLFVAG
ncbi:MAG: hypothetical protein NTX56_08165 [Proteobacteria bacterium]|nr:hypothetical protein [Pseudomonadota bacterium]